MREIFNITRKYFEEAKSKNSKFKSIAEILISNNDNIKNAKETGKELLASDYSKMFIVHDIPVLVSTGGYVETGALNIAVVGAMVLPTDYGSYMNNKKIVEAKNGKNISNNFPSLQKIGKFINKKGLTYGYTVYLTEEAYESYGEDLSKVLIAHELGHACGFLKGGSNLKSVGRIFAYNKALQYASDKDRAIRRKAQKEIAKEEISADNAAVEYIKTLDISKEAKKALLRDYIGFLHIDEENMLKVGSSTCESMAILNDMDIDEDTNPYLRDYAKGICEDSLEGHVKRIKNLLKKLRRL